MLKQTLLFAIAAVVVNSVQAFEIHYAEPETVREPRGSVRFLVTRAGNGSFVLSNNQRITVSHTFRDFLGLDELGSHTYTLRMQSGSVTRLTGEEYRNVIFAHDSFAPVRREGCNLYIDLDMQDLEIENLIVPACVHEQPERAEGDKTL